MAAIPVTIVGTFTNADGTAVGGTLEGSLSFTGLGVGGGPAQPPLGIWGPTDPRPTHPIAPGGQPPGIWGPPGPWPTPPIHIPPEAGAQPPGIWGPTDPRPTPPIYLPPGTIPGTPEHPIFIPPGSPGVPAHPIVLPPSPEPPQVLENWEVKTFWTPSSGWAVAIVPSEAHPGVPTPSAG